MSIEVYIINLVIGIATFFTLRWTFRKTLSTGRTLRIVLTWLGTIILTPVIYVGLILAIFSAMFYEPSRDFDKEKWFADKEQRHEMRNDLVKSELLKDKNKKEVLDLLGPPDFGSDTTNVWNYDLGTSTAGFGWQFNTLIVTFENGRVTKVEKREIAD